MSGSKMTIKPKPKPTDLFCEICLIEVNVLEPGYKTYFCNPCSRKLWRDEVLTFDEMTNAKFERAKHKTEVIKFYREH